MGKQSRRKNKGPDDKKAHKEKVKERRQRAIEALDENNGYDDDVEQSSLLSRQIEIGDRVRYRSPAAEEWKWGVVKSLQRGDKDNDPDDSDCYSILPWEASEDQTEMLIELLREAPQGDDGGRCMGRGLSMVEMRHGLWTLRFAPGDKVLCLPSEFQDFPVKGPYKHWRSATVGKLWPCWYAYGNNIEDPVKECYECIDDLSGESIFVLDDTDDNIVAFEKTKLRFSKGERVVFKTKAERWIEGKVVDTFVGYEDHYAGYSIRSDDKGRRALCTVYKDTDEYIARADAGPRERLFDAIDQNCSYSHLNHLVTTSNLDVSSFRDLILSRAIKACSYDALAWLQNTMKIDLSKIRDADDNGLLHQISASPNAHRFFEKAATTSKEDPGYITMQSSFEPTKAFIMQVDRRGRSWIHQLINSGNIRALDIALSSNGQFAVDLAMALQRYSFRDKSCDDTIPSIYTVTRDENGTSVRDAAKLLGRHDMVKIIDECAMWQTVYELATSIQCRPYWDRIKASTFPKFGGMANASILWKLRQVLSSRFGHFMLQSVQEICHDIAQYGDLPMLSWLVEGDPTLFDDPRKENLRTNANVDEFAQPDLFDNSLDNGIWEQLDLVSLAAHGEPKYRNVTDDARQFYASNRVLEAFLAGEKSNGDLAAYIKSMLVPKSYMMDHQDILEYKLHLLCDDELLSSRLETLNYLVKEKGKPPPDVLDIIRWRQCGVLRWMVSESLVDLTKEATDGPLMISKVTFLGDQSIPQSISVGTFLCFAAVEFDDLQTIQWLVNEKDVPVSIAKCNGWSLLYACAHFGRSEIAFWIFRHVTLSSGPTVATQFISEPCGRKGSRNLFAAHLAVQRGYIQLADFLISSGCPSHDKNGRSMSSYAKRSAHKFVQEWGKRNEQSMNAKIRLGKDIQVFYGLLSSPEDSENVAKVMAHINNSKCLDTNLWQDLEYDSCAVNGPLGKSYRDVIEDCCNMGKSDFIIRLVRTLTPPWYSEDLCRSFRWFWEVDGYNFSRIGLLDHEALLKFASEKNVNNELAVCLGKSWARNAKCYEPFTMNPLLKEISKHHGEDADVRTGLAQLRDSMLQDELSFRVLDSAVHETRRLLANTAPVESINNLLHAMKEISKNLDESILTNHFGRWKWMYSESPTIDVNCIMPWNYGNDHPLHNHSLFFHKAQAYLSAAYIVWAIEGCIELILWSLEPVRNGWDAEKELNTVRIAAYLGHRHVVDMFLQNNSELPLSSTLSERREAALLGALEAGFVDEINNWGLCPGSAESGLFTVVQSLDDDDSADLLQNSLVGVAVFGIVSRAGSKSNNNRGLTANDIKSLKWVASNTGLDHIAFVRAAVLAQISRQWHFNLAKFIDLYLHLIKLGLNPFDCQKETSIITKDIVSSYIHDKENEFLNDSLLEEWLTVLANHGLDIQSVGRDYERYSRHESLLRVVHPIQVEQLRSWSRFDVLREGGSLEAIQEAVVSGALNLACYDRYGLKLIHIAAAYDRVDVLEWLIEANPLQLDGLDGSGRSVWKVANASNATSTSLWISRRKAEERIHLFIVSSTRRRRAVKEKQTRLRLLTAVQAWYRGYLVRRAYRGHLLSRLEESQRFQAAWGHVLSLVENTALEGEISWGGIKTSRFDLRDMMDETGEGFVSKDHIETSKKLASATSLAAAALHDESLEPEAIGDDDEIDHSRGTESSFAGVDSRLGGAEFDRILLTRAVLRWRRQADPKYLEIFTDRITQLASGDRSLLLKKSLTGCKTVIYEAKLDAGQRILYQESRRGLIVWYVAKHDDVS